MGLTVFGAGGLAHQIVDHVGHDAVFITDTGGGTICGLPVQRFRADDAGELVVAVTDLAVRHRIAGQWRADLGQAVAPSAEISPHAKLSGGVIVCRQAIIEATCSIGEHSHVNLRGIVGHGSTVGRFCTIGPGAIVCGNCSIGDDVYIGAGAVVREGVTIGAGAFVAMGAQVHKDVPAGARVVGSRVFTDSAVVTLTG